MPNQRRSDRLYTQIPIRVSGMDSRGEAFQEETVTVSINQNGGCISLTHSLQPGQTISVMNTLNGREQEFRVVELMCEVFSNRAEWGVELVETTAEFWGVKFTPPPDSLEPKAMIRCMACSQVILTPLSQSGYDILLHTGLLSRHCDRCGETTRWEPSEVSTDGGATIAAARPLIHDERRKTRRRRVAMRLQLRRAPGQTEVVQTSDVSKGGLSFFSRQVLHVGDEVAFVLPFGGQKEPVEKRGRIVWARHAPGGGFYGVRLAAESSSSAQPSGAGNRPPIHEKPS